MTKAGLRPAFVNLQKPLVVDMLDFVPYYHTYAIAFMHNLKLIINLSLLFSTPGAKTPGVLNKDFAYVSHAQSVCN